MGRNCRFNILKVIHRSKGTQAFYIRKYLTRSLNEAGFRVSIFDEPRKFKGCVQWVLTSQYKSLSLDFSKYYIKIYCTENIETLHRDDNADEIIWNGWVFHPIPSQDWYSESGWVSVLAVRGGKYDGKPLN